MPQSGSYTAVVDKIKGRGTDDISLEELSTKLKQDDKNEHCEVCPELGLDLFAIWCLQELPCSCLPAHHCGSPTSAPWQEEFLNLAASTSSGAEKTFVFTLC